MDIKSVYRRFIEIEDQYDLFSTCIDNIKIWQFIRAYLYPKLVENICNIKFPVNGFKAVKTEEKVSLWHWIKTNPYLVHKKDLIIVGCPRRVYDGKYYVDLFTDEIICHLNYSYYLFERCNYMGNHYNPVKIKGIKYNDRYIRSQIKTCDGKEVKQKINKILDIFEKEFSMKWTNSQKKQIVSLSNTLLSNYNINYRRYCAFLLDRIKPKAVMLVKYYEIENMILIQEAKKRNIPIIELQHGMMDDVMPVYNYLKKHNFDTYPDYIFTFGEYDKKIAHYPIDKKYIIPVGYPDLEKKVRLYRRTETKKQITFFAGASIKLEEFAIYLNQVLDKNVYKIVFKLHPMQYQQWKKLYVKLADTDIEVIDNNHKDSAYYLAQSDFVIGIATTVLFEATLFPCKIGIVEEDDYQSMQSLYQNKHAYLVKTKEELVNFVTNKNFFEPEPGNYYEKNAISNINNALKKIITKRKN